MLLADMPDRGKRLKTLSGQWSEGRVAHAYMVESPRYGENRELAKALAKAVLCPIKPGYGCGECILCKKIDHENHEDLCFVQPEGSFLQDREVLPLLVALKTKPVGQRNVGFIMDGDRMTPTAQNRLLKTLEEPSPGAVIFLFCETADSLVATIRSRCRKISVEWDGARKGEEEAMALQLMQGMQRGNTYRQNREILSAILEDKEHGRKRALLLLDFLEEEYGKQLAGYSEKGTPPLGAIATAIRHIEETRRAILGNIGYGYALKNLLLEMGG
jgi:DNA polymerase III delta prime subunit